MCSLVEKGNKWNFRYRRWWSYMPFCGYTLHGAKKINESNLIHVRESKTVELIHNSKQKCLLFVPKRDYAEVIPKGMDIRWSFCHLHQFWRKLKGEQLHCYLSAIRLIFHHWVRKRAVCLETFLKCWNRKSLHCFLFSYAGCRIKTDH